MYKILMFFMFCFILQNVNAWSYQCNDCGSKWKSATEDTCKELGGKWNGSSCYNLSKFDACTSAPGHCATWGCSAKCF